MKTWLRTGPAVAALVLAGLLWACGDNGGDVTDPPPPDTEIRVTVTLDGDGREGVGVGLFQPGASTAQSSGTTSANGSVVFGDLSPGSYEVEVEIPSGTELDGEPRRAVSVAEGGSASVTFALTSLPATAEVEVRLTANLTFSPEELTIEPGTRVRWVNDVTMLHTITPEGHSEWTEGTVSSAGDTFEHTFHTAGTFPYFCSPHLNDGMTGEITVQ